MQDLVEAAVMWTYSCCCIDPANEPLVAVDGVGSSHPSRAVARCAQQHNKCTCKRSAGGPLTPLGPGAVYEPRQACPIRSLSQRSYHLHSKVGETVILPASNRDGVGRPAK